MTAHLQHEHAIFDDYSSARRMKWALILTATFMVLELVTSVWSRYLVVLVADGIHMLSDVLALGLTYDSHIVGAQSAR